MRKKLRIRDVFEFLRLALEVPAEEYLILQPFINQAHLATGKFGTKDGDKVTWYLQFMYEIISEVTVASSCSSMRTFVLPVTAGNHFTATENMPVRSGRLITARLDLKLWMREQKLAAVKGLASQLARANGRTAPLKIPAAVTKLLEFVGGSQHMLTLVMECIGGPQWQKDFDQRLAAIRAHDALYVLKQVRDKAHTSWNTILSSVDPEVKQESYMTLLANVLADTPVMPIDGILKPFQDCCLTHDALEAAKIVYFEIEDEIGHLQGKVSALSWMPNRIVRAPKSYSVDVRISMAPLVVAELLRDLSLVDEDFSDIVSALMMQDSSPDRVLSDARMGALSVLVFLDEQQLPWTIFIHTQQPGDDAAKTVKDVVCHLEDDLKETVTLPELSPSAWKDWHRTADDVPTGQLQAQSAVATAQNTKMPFDRVVYMYVSNSMFPSSEDHVYEDALSKGHPWLQHTTVISSHIRKAYHRRIGALAADALRHAILDKFLYGQGYRSKLS
ncbi:g7964 [Coccomyxa viridis]|uniref:G7964 protein n=1 Tax=Coccomyxa viridis TaxID=1274662 RepID=A0ABP1G5X6_9CHLO